MSQRAVALLPALAIVWACAPDPQPDAGAPGGTAVLELPAATGSFAPNLGNVGGELAATWLEPVAATEPGTEETSHRLRFSRLGEGGWSTPVSIAEGSDFFANWADFPELVEAGDGTLYAHWLAKTAEDTYAYSVFLARSLDSGASWEALGKLNSDDTPTEHGFVALVPEAEGARAFWLDGREMLDQGPMTVRTALLEDPAGTEEVLDARVCECCGTDAVATARGPVVAYRDRSQAEVRDVFVARKGEDGWTEPEAVHEDGWEIAGCPVNGPAIDAAGERVAVAWFTAAGDQGRVQIAFSGDAGASFEEPIVVAAAEDSGVLVLGRVDVSMDASGAAWMSWVSKPSARAEVLVQRIDRDGTRGELLVVAETSPGRASGFPILERVADRLYIAWVEIGEDRSASAVRVRRL